MGLDQFIKNGFLKKCTPDFMQIEKQIAGAWKDLKTANKLLEDDIQWSATISYHAMLRAGRALLYSHGYLPADGQQHKTVVQVVGIVLGKEIGDLILKFDRLRRKRNVFIYDVDEGGSLTETRNSLLTAEQLLKIICEKISELSPQISLNFDK